MSKKKIPPQQTESNIDHIDRCDIRTSLTEARNALSEVGTALMALYGAAEAGATVDEYMRRACSDYSLAKLEIDNAIAALDAGAKS